MPRRRTNYNPSRFWIPEDMSGIIACWNMQIPASYILSGGRMSLWASTYTGYAQNMVLHADTGTPDPLYESTGLNALPCWVSSPLAGNNGGMYTMNSGPIIEDTDFIYAFVGQFDTEDAGIIMGYRRTYLKTSVSPFEIGFAPAENENIFLPITLSSGQPFFYIWNYQASPATVTTTLNGEYFADNQAAGPIPSNSDTFKICDRHLTQSANTYLENAKFGEIIIGNSFQNNTNVDIINGYLAWNWGLQSLLPGGHPYKNTRPTI